jgi:hypothetical protein
MMGIVTATDVDSSGGRSLRIGGLLGFGGSEGLQSRHLSMTLDQHTPSALRPALTYNTRHQNRTRATTLHDLAVHYLPDRP